MDRKTLVMPRLNDSLIMAAVLLAGLRLAGAAEPVKVVPVSEEGRPAAAKIDAQGTIHLVFTTADGPRYARSTDGGATFGQSLAIVDQASRKPGLEFSVWDVAVSPQGYVHVALGTNGWKLKLPQEEWALHYARLAPGAEKFDPIRNLNHKPSEGFSLAADEKGRVTACWLSGKLYANVSQDNGKTFGPTAEIDSTIDPCDCCTTSATYGSDGKLAVLYREETNNERDMFLVLWDQERNSSTRTRISRTLWTIDACPMSYFEVTRNGQGLTAVWPTKGDIYFARLDGKGVPQSPGEIKTKGTTGMRTGMMTLSSPDGSTLVASKNKGELHWQIYDVRGHVVGKPGSCDSAGASVAGVVTEKGDFILFR